MNTPITRRDVLVTGSLAMLASTMGITTAEAKSAPLTATEQANIDMVKRFLASCSEKPFDVEKLVATYFAPNASVRWADNLPPAVGADAAIAAAKALMPPESSLDIKLLDVFARGPLVATSRIDVVRMPGKPEAAYPIAGVHIIQNGKFVEYCDYMFEDKA